MRALVHLNLQIWNDANKLGGELTIDEKKNRVC
jgi:hypothetical protein